MSDHIEILKNKLAETMHEIQRLSEIGRGLAMAIELIEGDDEPVRVPIRTLADVPHMEPLPDIPSPLADIQQPGRKQRNPRPPQGKPWLAPGSAVYWLKNAGAKNVDNVRELLRGETEGITQPAIAEILDINTATVTRALRCLWKYGELEFLGRVQSGQGQQHSTRNVWRLWTGEGAPPDPEARWNPIRRGVAV